MIQKTFSQSGPSSYSPSLQEAALLRSDRAPSPGNQLVLFLFLPHTCLGTGLFPRLAPSNPEKTQQLH